MRFVLATAALTVCAGHAFANAIVNSAFREVNAKSRLADFGGTPINDVDDGNSTGATSGIFDYTASASQPGSSATTVFTSDISNTLMRASWQFDGTSDGYVNMPNFIDNIDNEARGDGDFQVNFSVSQTGLYDYAFGWELLGLQSDTARVQIIDLDAVSVLIQRTDSADGSSYTENGQVMLVAGTTYLVDLDFSTQLGQPFGPPGPLVGSGELDFRLTIPAPGAAAILACGGLAATRRRR